jgi:hypothetical protein
LCSYSCKSFFHIDYIPLGGNCNIHSNVHPIVSRSENI